MAAAITINFRRPDLTQACVESLLEDGWAPVMIWDNSDDGGASVRVLQDQYADNPKVLVQAGPANLGFGRGMNAALLTLGKLGFAGPVLLVNNDAQALPGLRSALMAVLDATVPPTLVAPRIVQQVGEGGWLHYQPCLALVTKHPVPGSFPYLSGCCLLVNRRDNSLPLFDEAFFMYGEDVELSWRIHRQGGRLVLLEHAGLRHEGAGSSRNGSLFYEYQVSRGHWLLACKLSKDPVQAWLALAGRMFSLPTRALLRAARMRSRLPIVGLWMATRDVLDGNVRGLTPPANSTE